MNRGCCHFDLEKPYQCELLSTNQYLFHTVKSSHCVVLAQDPALPPGASSETSAHSRNLLQLQRAQQGAIQVHLHHTQITAKMRYFDALPSRRPLISGLGLLGDSIPLLRQLRDVSEPSLPEPRPCCLKLPTVFKYVAIPSEARLMRSAGRWCCNLEEKGARKPVDVRYK